MLKTVTDCDAHLVIPQMGPDCLTRVHLQPGAMDFPSEHFTHTSQTITLGRKHNRPRYLPAFGCPVRIGNLLQTEFGANLNLHKAFGNRVKNIAGIFLQQGGCGVVWKHGRPR